MAEERDGFIRVTHSKFDAVAYVDVSKITHIVDLRNSVRIHVGPSGEYIATTDAIETVLDKLSKARGGKTKKAA